MSNERRMPERINLGKSYHSPMATPMRQLSEWRKNPAEINPHGLRTVMGYCLPAWQRGLVWSDRLYTDAHGTFCSRCGPSAPVVHRAVSTPLPAPKDRA